MVTKKPRTRARAKLDAQGRLLVPAEIRERLGMNPGDNLILAADDDELVVLTAQGGWRKAQRIGAEYKISGQSMVDELIAERRAEAARE